MTTTRVYHLCQVAIAAAALVALLSLATWGADASTRSNDLARLDTTALGAILGVTRISEGRVTVELTPEKHAKGRLTVSIRVNTHSVNDLDKYDLKAITRLEFDGKKLAPSSAPKLRGHHNAGELVFPLQALPTAFTIKIENLDQRLRVFSWP